MNSLKGRIKYDRNALLMIRDQASIKDFDVADRGLPELAKDHLPSWRTQTNRGGSIGPVPARIHPFPMPPPILSFGGRNGMGIMNWGGAMFVPPPPPPPHPYPYPPHIQPPLQLQHISTPKVGPKSDETKKLMEPQPCAVPVPISIVYKSVDKELIVNRVKKLLDMLTSTNYDNLIFQFTTLPLKDAAERILCVVGVVLEKALGNPSLLPAQYANILKVMCKGSPETTEIFRQQILSKLQEFSSKNKTLKVEIQEEGQRLTESIDERSRDQLKLELEEKQYLHKRNTLATAALAMELCKVQLLKPEIMENNFPFPLDIPNATDRRAAEGSPASVESAATTETPGNENGSACAGPMPITGVSTCAEILDTEMKNAALTLQRLSLEGSDIGLDERVKLLKYIRECAQTLESLREPGKCNV